MKNDRLSTINPANIEAARVKFYELDSEQKLEAIQEMLHLSKAYNFPGNIWWENEDGVKESIDNGYSPDKHFSFFAFEDGVAVKIS